MAKQILIASRIHVYFKLLFIAMYRFAFDTFDTNNDKLISFEEFLISIAATSQGDLDDRLAVAFDL